MIWPRLDYLARETMRRLYTVSLVVLALVGCQGANSAARTYSGSYPIRVVCTTGMVADLARHIGGEQVQIEQLLGADVDPHLYKATPGDMRTLGKADVI